MKVKLRVAKTWLTQVLVCSIMANGETEGPLEKCPLMKRSKNYSLRSHRDQKQPFKKALQLLFSDSLP